MIMDASVKLLGVGRRSFDDPFFKEGDAACSFFARLCVYDIDEEELCHNVSKEFSCEVPCCKASFSSLMEFELHYNTLHRYVCSVCHKTLPSPHFLDLHVEENHDSFFSLQAERKPMYQCLVEDCDSKFRTAGERKDHCLKIHSFPPNFRWLMPAGNAQTKKKKSAQSKQAKNITSTKMELEQNSDTLSSECNTGDVAVNESEATATRLLKKQKQHRKKQTAKSNKMEAECANSCSFSDAHNNDPSMDVVSNISPDTESGSTQIASKNKTKFKGFIPRNISANRTFSSKAYIKGKDWHNTTTPEKAVPSSLETDSLSADLRDSLPVDMDAS